MTSTQSIGRLAAFSEPALTSEELRRIDAYWRACNYLCAGMIYLHDNPLLREPLRPEHFKNRLLGHWGSDPGQTFTWVHLNRVIKKYDLDMIYISRSRVMARRQYSSNAYLEGTYSEVYPDKSQDGAGCIKLFEQFSFPGGIGSHCTPETPGSIHEGGELGYSMSHAFGAAFDNPDLIVSCDGGRRRSGDRTAGDRVAFQQIPQPDPRRRSAADPASERLQDRQSHAPGPHHPDELEALFGLRMDAVLCRG